MSISVIIVLWIIITIVQAVNDRKKVPPPPPVPPRTNPTDLDFEIPTLANDPNQDAEFEDFEEEFEETDSDKWQRTPKKNKSAKKIQSEIESVEEKNIELDLTPAAVMNSIIMNEILDKPKALRRKKI